MILFLLLICLLPAASLADEPPVGQALDPAPDAERMLALSWFLPGQVLHREAQQESPVMARLTSLSLLPVVEEKEGWQEVVYRGRRSWVDSDWQIPWDREQAQRGLHRKMHEKPLSLTARSKELRLAKKMMKLEEPRRVGAMTLYTDVQDEPLLRLLEQAIEIVPRAHFSRFARLPGGDPEQAVILFRERQDFIFFLGKVGLAAGRGSGGFATARFVVLWVGPRSDLKVTSVLIHELTHLLNRRSLASSLPPWLEEGLATDLGSIWVEPQGPDPALDSALDPALASIGWYERSLQSLYWLAKKGEMPGVGALSTLDRKTFSHSPYTGLAYTHAGTLIRFLRDHPEYGERFLDFLRRVASGFTGNMGLLLDSLEMDIETLDQIFRRWVESEGRRLDESQRVNSLKPMSRPCPSCKAR